MYRTLALMVVTASLLLGCSSRMTKNDFIDYCDSIDWYEVHENMAQNKQWENCFQMTEEEVKHEINYLYSICTFQEYGKLPPVVTYKEKESFMDGIDICARTRFLQRNKDKFYFNPDYPRQYKLIKSLMDNLK